MILYNVTINIDDAVHDQWLRWMKTDYIPAMLKSGLIIENKVLKLLTELDNGGSTYSFQYFLKNMADYDELEKTFVPVLQEHLYELYKNKYVEFTTLLEVI